MVFEMSWLESSRRRYQLAAIWLVRPESLTAVAGTPRMLPIRICRR